MIPFLDLKKQYKSVQEEINRSIHDVLDKGNFVLGEKVEEFEKKFAKFCNAKYCVSVGSGTDALTLSSAALGLKKLDEVIMPSHTFISTAYSVLGSGAVPVFSDIDESTFNISAVQASAKITKNTKAILPVHMYGQYCDMGAISDVAKDKNLAIIEDACQATGSEYRGKKGVFGDLACFSFYPTKVLGAYGDAGAILTNNEEFAEKLRLLRNYGQDSKYHHLIVGKNSRMDEIQSAVLLAKLPHLEDWVNSRRRIAKRYDSLLSDSPVQVPVESNFSKHSYYLYVIRSKKRDLLQKHLLNSGIGSMVHYPIPCHKQPSLDKGLSLPVTEGVANEILSIPMYPELTDSEIESIGQAILGFTG